MIRIWSWYFYSVWLRGKSCAICSSSNPALIYGCWCEPDWLFAANFVNHEDYGTMTMTLWNRKLYIPSNESWSSIGTSHSQRLPLFFYYPAMKSRVDMFAVRDFRVHLKEPNPSKRLCGASDSVPTRVLATLHDPSVVSVKWCLTHESQTPLIIRSKTNMVQKNYLQDMVRCKKFTLKFTETHHAPGLWHMFRTSTSQRSNGRKGHLLPMAIMSFMLLLVTVDVPRWWNLVVLGKTWN